MDSTINYLTCHTQYYNTLFLGNLKPENISFFEKGSCTEIYWDYETGVIVSFVLSIEPSFVLSLTLTFLSCKCNLSFSLKPFELQ